MAKPVEQSPEATRKASWWDRYVRTAPSPPLEPIRDSLWSGVAPNSWEALNDTTRSTVLEQYKVYVEAADRISARRGLANSFFLTLNTTIVTLVGIFADHPVSIPRFALVVPWLALITQCLAWFWILRSYRQLNTAKYAVVAAIEEVLPLSPWWRAEWAAVGQGKDPSRYWPLSHVEQIIPPVFGATYTLGFLLLIAR